MLTDLSAARLRLCALLGAGLVAACGSAPGPQEIPPGTEFSTRILADGTKLFTLKSHPGGERGPGGAGPGMGGARGGRSSGGDCFPCGPGEQRGAGGARGREREADLRAVAAAMIAGNRYCRDGFVVLEQFQQERARILRGECRDGADAGDRAKFTPGKN